MKIFDYNPGFGTFSAGFETWEKNEVVETLRLMKNNQFPYNNIHKQWFLPSFCSISDYEPEKSFDLAIFQPDIGGKIGRRSKTNFTNRDFCNCLTFLKREMPEFAIFVTEIDAVALLNTAKAYVRDGFNQLSSDFVIHSLQQMGYDAYLIAIDEAGYGIPSHRSFAFYIATPQDFDLQWMDPAYTKEGVGNYKKYRTIADAIGDLGPRGDWVPYATAAQNIYQYQMRRGGHKVTWHHIQNIRAPQKETMSCIKQGQDAKSTKQVKQTKGYKRPFWTDTPILDDRFYLASSDGSCLHPNHDRPFTIREGCRLLGLPDTLSFELSVPNKEVAHGIYKSVAPAIGELMAVALCEI